jgi:hypothetical protein
MSSLSTGLAIAGAGTSLLGGLIGGGGSNGPSSDERNAQAVASRYADEEVLYGGMARQLAAILGPEQARQVLRGSMSSQAYERLFGRAGGAVDQTATRNQIREIEDRLRPYRSGGGNGISDRAAAAAGINVQEELNRLRELQSSLTTGTDPGQRGTIDSAAFDQMGPGVAGQYDALATRAGEQGNEAIRGYSADTQRLLGMSRDIEGGAQEYGNQERVRINRDSDRALTSANRATESRLIGRGLGASTALTQQLTGNARQIEETRQDALGNLGDRRIQMLNNLRGNTLNLAGQRLGGQTSLLLGNQDRTLGYQQQALGVRTNALTSGTTNPWLTRSTGAYTPGLAPAQPSQSASWGNFLASLGGQAFNAGGMEILRRNGFGGQSNAATQQTG